MSFLPIVLVGLPGAGKSRVAKALAKRTGLRAIDTDTLIEQNAGKKISAIFEENGEGAFREKEQEAIEKALQGFAVVSVGGGAVETAGVRELLRGKTVVHIDAPDKLLLTRVEKNKKRPLLRDNTEAKLAEMREVRDPLFEEVRTLRVLSSEAPVTAVVEQIMSGLWGADIVWVDADGGYPVFIGNGGVQNALKQTPRTAMQALLVAPKELSQVAAVVQQGLEQKGLTVVRFMPPSGETQKTYEVAEQGWNLLGAEKFGRADLIVGLGGGATTDLAGFLAATWNRGMPVIQIPTTLLAMVDAAIGGKTGINTSAGKNLVGAFHSPISVGADPQVLSTLPQGEFLAGMGELVKCGFIADPEILRIIERNPKIGDVQWATSKGMHALQELIRRAVVVKAKVVGEDLFESGHREILNYGHTLAHAIERESGYKVRHGEAVAIGCCYAAGVARDLGLLDEESVNEHFRVFGNLGLPTTWQGSFEPLLDAMYSDKKTRGNQLRFVLLDGPGKPISMPVEPDVLRKVWDSR